MRWLGGRALALAVGLSALAAPLPSPAADPLEINVIVSMTGSGSFTGQEEAKSLGLEQAMINANGGVDGRPVKFVLLDDQTSPQVAVQLAGKLVAASVPVIIGPSQVGACQAVWPLTRGKTVIYCISSGFHPERNSFAFYAGMSTAEQLAFGIGYLHAHGLKRFATLTSTDANGQDADRMIAAALARPEYHDMSLVASEHFTVTDLTVNAQMVRIKASGAQALINYNTGSPFGTVLHAYNDLGLTIPLVSQPAALNNTVVRQYKAILPRDFLITALVGDAPSVAPRGAVSAAIDALQNAYRQSGERPDHSAMLAWDPALIVVAAYKKLGVSATGAEIDDFIQNLHGWAGVNGEYDFRTGQSGLSPRSLVMVRWDAEHQTWEPASQPGEEFK